MNNKDFYFKTAFVTVAVLLVIFSGKMWIVNPLMSNSRQVIASAPATQGESSFAGNQEKRFSKEKININWKDAAKYVDSYVIFEGEIVSAYNNGKVCYLNLDKDYKNSITLVIFSTKFSRFPDKPEKCYLGKKVRVEGRIKDYKGRLEIILGGTESIKVL
ncbi:MAG: OB-fold nucleic acid binding domain-containing protein [bacterium]|jgi:DNA/RNA endonuclease YhcR with UshA esterase domain